MLGLDRDKETDAVPTYQYSCTACGVALEAQQRFTDDPLTTCPECSGQLRKVFSAVGVVFKGSGFYRTDSRTSSNGASNGASDKPAAAGKTDSSKSGSESSSTTSSGSKETAKAGSSA